MPGLTESGVNKQSNTSSVTEFSFEYCVSKEDQIVRLGLSSGYDGISSRPHSPTTEIN